MPHDVFLSYASADRAAADAVCTALESRGIKCWMAPRDVPAGADWGEAILTAIGRAHAMVLVLSRNTSSSVHVRNEVVTAVSQSLALAPVRIEDCQPAGALRLHLAGSHWLNVFPPPIEQHAEALAAGVRLALAADATIELPRAQAAALVAAARAATAAGPLPMAQQRPPPSARPAAPMRPGAAATPATAAGPSIRAPHLPRAAPGLGVILAIGVAVLVAGACAAALYYEPRLRGWLGFASPAPASAPPTSVATLPPSSAPAPAPAASEGSGDAPRQGFSIQGALAGLGLGSPRLPGAAAPAPVPEPPVRPMPAVATPPRGLAPIVPGLGGNVPPSTIAPPARLTPESAAVPPAGIGVLARLVNAGDLTISQLFISRPDERIGTQDWLGQAQVTPGNAIALRIPPGQGCVFNIRVVYVGGRTEDRPGIDLCAAPELRFEGSTGAARAPQR